jgi:hypothetical protein
MKMDCRVNPRIKSGEGNDVEQTSAKRALRASASPDSRVAEKGCDTPQRLREAGYFVAGAGRMSRLGKHVALFKVEGSSFDQTAAAAHGRSLF